MASTSSVRVVHVVAKTHLDLGFTALAADVEARYLEELFPRAIDVAARLRAGNGPDRLVWTTGSWILDRALDDPDRARAAAVADAVERGDLAWHALPLTFHTELMDADLVRSALGISASLDARFGRSTTAAKMTDVPGHTRGLVPLLADAGVTFLHVGVNPAWPVPDVPELFRWRSPDGSEVTVAHRSGGYGGEVVVPGADEVLAFIHAGDNAGPPSVEEVVSAHDVLRARHRGAEVRASTLDAFARALVASGAVPTLPLVTAEIGDPWLFGAASDPQKLRSFRDVLARRRSLRSGTPAATAVDRRLLLVAEHTWGLDQKEVLPVEPRWDAASLVALRNSPAGRRFEASWAEQRAYVEDAARLVPPAVGVPVDPRTVDRSWDLAVDETTGALRRADHLATGRSLAADDRPLGLLHHQTFSDEDYERFYGQLQTLPADEWWSRRDNTKPGIDSAGAVTARQFPTVVDIEQDEGARALVIHLRFPGGAVERVGAPGEVWVRWAPVSADVLGCTLWWEAKPATRLPEATWFSFVPAVTEPERWVFDKLGQEVSPLDVVRRGGRALHAVGEAIRYAGPEGRLEIRTPDAPLVAPGAPNLLDADPPVPDLAGGLHVLLHDNCWGTNFPMWNEGAASFSFTLSVAGDPQIAGTPHR